MKYLVILLVITAVIYLINVWKRFQAHHREMALWDCKAGQLAIGFALHHCWDKDKLDVLRKDIDEWRVTYYGKVEMGAFKKLEKEIESEWHAKFRQLKD